MVYDYIVIGSGFGGSVASLRLVEKGYKVLTTEQGKRYRPEDFPKTNWNLPKYLWVPSLRFFGFRKLSFYTTASILSGTGVGGGSLVYANTLYIPGDAFFGNPSWSRFGNWKEILKPYYDRASFMLGRTKYIKLNPEDLAFEEVSKERNPNPLAVYIFTRNRKLAREFLMNTKSGSAAINDTVIQFASPYLPFGGLGSSGMGRYHGKSSFETFSNVRGVMVKSNLIDLFLRYPPYNKLKEKAFKWFMR